jgi:hypothetical protein
MNSLAATTVQPERRPEVRTQKWRRYHLLALLPAVGMLGGLPFANRVYPLILGLPFLFAWLVGWVIATSLIMGYILRLDRTHGVIQPSDRETHMSGSHRVE